MANFYCRFIKVFSRMAAGLMNMLKSGKKNKFKKIKFKMILKAIKLFEKLKRYF